MLTIALCSPPYCPLLIKELPTFNRLRRMCQPSEGDMYIARVNHQQYICVHVQNVPVKVRGRTLKFHWGVPVKLTWLWSIFTVPQLSINHHRIIINIDISEVSQVCTSSQTFSDTHRDRGSYFHLRLVDSMQYASHRWACYHHTAVPTLRHGS